MPALIVDPAKCTKCGICVKICPADIIRFGEAGLPEMDAKEIRNCIKCGHCVLFCPSCADSLSFQKNEELAEVSGLAMPSKKEGLNLLKTRRSIRCFKEGPVPKEVLAEIFEAVRMAPTASNSQMVRWIVSDDPEKTKEIVNLILRWLHDEMNKKTTSRLSLIASLMIEKAKEGKDGLLRGAPQAAFAVVPKDYGWPEDGAIALTYLGLAAHSMGVGACWGGFLTMAVRNFSDLRNFLGINEDEHLCGAQMLGYPQLKPVRQFPPRKNLNITWL